MAGFTERRKQLKEKLKVKKEKSDKLMKQYKDTYGDMDPYKALEQEIITATSGKYAPRTSKRPKARPNRAADTKNVTKIGPY